MKTERKRQLKGSVLFTVVSVMSLLIIFLMATLVLATSAGKRAHKSYSTSQTQYTARTAVDSVFQAIGASQDFADAIDALSASNKGPLNVEVQIADTPSMGRIESCTVTWEGSQSFYNEDKKEWQVKDLLKITANVSLGGQTTTGSSYILKDPPQHTTQNGGGAGFVTAGSAATANHTSAFGGTYFNIREYVNPDDPATAYATLPYDFTTKNYLTNDNFTLRNGQIIESEFVVNGNLNMSTTGIVTFPAPGTGTVIWGDLIYESNGAGLVFTAYNIDNDMDIDYTDIPYLYVDGHLKSSLSSTFGNGSFPMNIFCDTMEILNSSEVYADIYCMAEGKTSTIEGNGNATLYEWTSSVINKTVQENAYGHSFSNIYSKGNLEIDSNKKQVINGDLRVQGNLTISGQGEVVVTGDVVVGGTLTINPSQNGIKVNLCTDSGSKLYCDNIVNNCATLANKSDAEKAAMFKVNGTGFGYSEVKPGFAQIDNIYHEPSYTVNLGYKETKNIPNFYKYEVVNNTGLFGEANVWATEVYYKYTAYNEATPDDPATMDGSRYYNTWEIGGEWSAGGYLYTEVDANWISLGTGTDVPAYYYEMATGNKVDASVATTVVPEFYTIADYDGVNITDSGTVTTDLISFFDLSTTPPTRVSEATAVQTSSNELVANYKDPERSTPTRAVTNIYPIEMEKKVILGMNNSPGDPVIYGYKNGNYQALTKEDTQIIQTVRDIVNNNNINPYDNALYSIPSGYQSQVNSNVYSADHIGKYVKNGTEYFKDNGTDGRVPYDGTAEKPITESCTITAGSAGADVYFDVPDGKEIWVKIDGNVAVENGTNFYFMDEGKLPTTKLNIILSSGATLELKSNANIVSQKMYKLVNDPNQILTVTNYSGIANPAGSIELDPAQIYIYTVENTANKNAIATLIMGSGNSLLTANIKAPYLDFQCYTGYECKAQMYYNGARINGYSLNTSTDIQSPPIGNYEFIGDTDDDTLDYNFKINAGGINASAPTSRIPVIGCLNVASATQLQNNWVLLYIDPNKNSQPPVQTPNNNHWYQTIYYDEY